MTTPSEHTRPNGKTRDAEHADEHAAAHADREPTAAEAKLAEEGALDPEVAKHAEEMTKRGANQQGEGRLP